MSSPSLTEAEIFNVARHINSPEARQRYILHACAAHSELRARVEALLRVHDEEQSFLAKPASGLPATQAVAVGDGAGTQIGPYKLMEQIGEGGMGLVFVAEQHVPVRRKVALKIIKPGMDNQEVIARFEVERQALALMDHPNIARVLDAGTTETGRPFFVMELVKGIPLVDYCDQQQLTTRERLELFLSVCQAVQHAHSKGIIHRDLKPSNILVAPHDGLPVVKVIDFGVAKALGQQLTDKTIYTRFMQMIGTPLYMSPEQAELNALDVDTRSDIYSLGVLLYELLTGTTPFDSKRLASAAFDEIRRIIREEEPPRPSTRLSQLGVTLSQVSARRKTPPAKLSAIVKGELDWIVMKALEKDRNRRYETAAAFAADVRRFLKQEPIEARPPSAWYRFRKLAQRNKVVLITAGLVAAALVLGTAISTWQALRATQAEQDANTERDVAQENARAADEARDETRHERDKVANVNQQLTGALGDLRRALYISGTSRAYQFWNDGDVQRAMELLERQSPKGKEEDMRGIEWYYLRELCRRFQAAMTFRAGSPVERLALSPDGQALATESDEGQVKLWDTSTGALCFAVPTASSALAFSSESKCLVVASANYRSGLPIADGTIHFWDVATGKERATTRLPLARDSILTLSADAALLAGFAYPFDGKMSIWDVDTGRRQAILDARADEPKPPVGNSQAVAFGPEHKQLAWCMGPTVMVWDLTTKKLVFKHDQGTLWSFSLAFSPDGKLLACHHGGPPHVVQLWDLSTGKQVAELQNFEGHVYALAFSRDGRWLAAGSERGPIRLWDVAKRRDITMLKGHGGTITGLAFAPHGEWLYSGSYDGLARRWSLALERDPDTIPGDIALIPLRLGFTDDGKQLFVAGAGKLSGNTAEIRHLDTATAQERVHLRSDDVLTVSPDCKRAALAAKEGTVTLWDVVKNRPGIRLEGYTWKGKTKSNRPYFAPDGRTFVVVEKGKMLVWDARQPKPRRILQVPRIEYLRGSPDGRVLATLLAPTEKDHVGVRLWDLATLRPLADLHVPARSIAFSPDSRTLAIAEPDAIGLWSLSSYQRYTRLEHSAGMVLWVKADFSADGRLFAMAADRVAYLWDTHTGRRRGVLKGHHQLIHCLAFSPDGKTLATGSLDGVVKLWNVAAKEEVTSLTGPNGVARLTFAADGTLAVAYYNDSIHLWRPGPTPSSRSTGK